MDNYRRPRPPSITERILWLGLGVVVLLVFAFCSGGHAAGVRSTTCFGRSCVTTWGPAGTPGIVHVPGPTSAEDAALAEERDRAWVERCRPVPNVDRYGVTRYTYALPGCEYGAGQ